MVNWVDLRLAKRVLTKTRSTSPLVLGEQEIRNENTAVRKEAELRKKREKNNRGKQE